MRYLRKLYKELKPYLDPDHLRLVVQAYRQAARAHQKQKRHSGEAYITHPVAVATILAKMRLDYQTIAAALLHDVLEDTDTSKAEIARDFGEEVAELVDGVSKLTQIEFETRAHAQAENFRKMMLAMAKDIRVILVKLADRLHNMRTLGALPPHKLQRICEETLDIYAPIANRLGMHAFRVEYEELGFAALYPRRYAILKRAVKRTKGNQKEMIQRVQRAMTKQLKAWGLAGFMLSGREKQVYSIYHKMRAKRRSFAEIMDIYGFRVIVDRMDDCYRALGALHNLYKPIPDRFKDYIASPKSNGYQSLHTTLFGPYGVPLEIQFRTEEMHQTADNGIAAHWLYKSKESYANDAHQRAKEWVNRLLELQEGAGNSLEFIEHVKIDLFPNEVYLFTPKGTILELPAKSTPIDFAYAVHSEVGNTCVAAKVDKRLVPLHTVLKNGQTVEIITSPDARPNAFWLNVVKTGKAKSAIRHFFKSQRRGDVGDTSQEVLVIKGTEGESLDYAACCQPIMGDDIIGIARPGRGIEVHRLHCVELVALRAAPDDCRRMLSWQAGLEVPLPVKIFIDAEDRVGLLAKIITALGEKQVHIKHIEATENGSFYCRVTLVILAKHRQHLEETLLRLARVDGVLSACRAVDME